MPMTLVKWLAPIFLLLAFEFPASAGHYIRHSCGKCMDPIILMLGRGIMSSETRYPMICRNKAKVRIIAFAKKAEASFAKFTTDCAQGLEPLRYLPEMDCPVCPGTPLKREFYGFWD
jgi:hypothetical protein